MAKVTKAPTNAIGRRPDNPRGETTPEVGRSTGRAASNIGSAAGRRVALGTGGSGRGTRDTTVGAVARQGIPAGRGQTSQDVSAPGRRPTPVGNGSSTRKNQMDQMVRNRNTMNQTPVGKTAGRAASDTRSILENAFRKNRKK